MKKEKTNHLRIISIIVRRGRFLVAFIALMAGLLLWTAYAPGDKTQNLADASMYLNESQYVSSSTVVSSDETREFFTQYRMDRQKARAEELEYLNTHVLGDSAASETEKTQARSRIFEITDTMETELIAENLIRTKGYSDALVFLHEGGINVVVAKDTLSEMDVARISAVVQEVSGIAPGKIVVSVDKSL